MPGRVARVLTCGALGLSAASATAASPRVVAGWPVPTAAGSVHPGPGGGPIVIHEGYAPYASPGSTVSAFRLGGALRWLSASDWPCGNCDDGNTAPKLQANGTYGPIGPDGDGVWSVTAAGTTALGCTGAFLTDSTCISHEGRLDAMFRDVPAILARRGSTTLWEFTQPNLNWSINFDFGVPPRVLVDETGTAYSTLGRGNDLPTAAPIPPQLLALDASTGTVRWRVPEAEPLTELPAGVLALKGPDLVAYQADGAVRWTFPLPRGVGISAVHVDASRRRAYASVRSTRDANVRWIQAIDLDTGSPVWATFGRDRERVLSLTPSGNLLVAVRRSTRPGIRALSPLRTPLWHVHTTTEVIGAQRLPDGTVAFSTRGATLGGPGGLLWRVDPRRTAPTTLGSSLRLQRTTFTAGCASLGCLDRPDFGVILRTESRRATTITVRLLDTTGRVIVRKSTIAVPVGASAVRLFTDGSQRITGRHVVHITRANGSVVQFPVRLVPEQ